MIDAKAIMVESANQYIASDTCNWADGISLMLAMSTRYGRQIPEDLYEGCLRKVAAMKPLLRGREHKFFPPDFALSMDKIRVIVDDANKDTFGRLTKSFDYATGIKAMKYDIPQINTLDDFKIQARKVLGKRAGLFKDFKGRRFLTFGSCFANHVGTSLRDLGASVYVMTLTEDINSPFNNALLLRRVFLGEDSPLTKELQEKTGIDYNALRDQFVNATDIIFTLGNIFHLIGESGTTGIARTAKELIKETPDETKALLREIVDLLKAHCTANLFVSVSPVPISGYRGQDFQTALEADSASKCQLMTALRSVDAGTYLPTFEIFKWLPPHQSFVSFGSDDGNTRHLVKAHVSAVMELLCA